MIRLSLPDVPDQPSGFSTSAFQRALQRCGLPHLAEGIAATGSLLPEAFSSAGLGLWAMDLSTGAVRWSDAQERLHGLAPGSFQGTLSAFRDLIAPEDRGNIDRAIRRTTRAVPEFVADYRLMAPGRVREVRMMGRVAFDGKGARVAAVGMTVDVTTPAAAARPRARRTRNAHGSEAHSHDRSPRRRPEMTKSLHL